MTPTLVTDLFTELGVLDTGAQKQLSELDALTTFYDKICKTLPVEELLPELVAQRVITIDDKEIITVTGRTQSEKTQYLLDHYIARPLSARDPNFFYKLLDVMATSTKCNFLISDIQHYLSTTMGNQKFSGQFIYNNNLLL